MATVIRQLPYIATGCTAPLPIYAHILGNRCSGSSTVDIIGELGAAMNRHFVYKTVGFMTPMGFLIRKTWIHPVGLVGVH